jgi:hypothetical protein
MHAVAERPRSEIQVSKDEGICPNLLRFLRRAGFVPSAQVINRRLVLYTEKAVAEAKAAIARIDEQAEAAIMGNREGVTCGAA